MDRIPEIRTQMRSLMQPMIWDEFDDDEEEYPTEQEIQAIMDGVIKRIDDAAAYIDDEAQRVYFYQAVLAVMKRDDGGDLRHPHKMSDSCRYLVGYERDDGVFKPFENGLLLGQPVKGEPIHKQILECLWLSGDKDEDVDKPQPFMKTFAQAWEFFHHFSTPQADEESLYCMIRILGSTDSFRCEDATLLKQFFDRYRQWKHLSRSVSEVMGHPLFTIPRAIAAFSDPRITPENIDEIAFHWKPYLKVLWECPEMGFKPEDFPDVYHLGKLERFMGILHFMQKFHYCKNLMPNPNLSDKENEEILDVREWANPPPNALETLKDSIIRMFLNEDMDCVRAADQWFQNNHVLYPLEPHKREIWGFYPDYYYQKESIEDLKKLPLWDIFMNFDKICKDYYHSVSE